MDARVDHSERIEAMRHLLALPRLDFESAMALLNTPPATVQANTAEAVKHARIAVAAAPGNDGRHQAVARYALARFTVALEAEQAIAVLPPPASGD